MSFHISVITIEGNHVDEIADVIMKFGYDIQNTVVVETGEEAEDMLDWDMTTGNISLVTYYSNGWTFIVDPSFFFFNYEGWANLSKKWNTRIYSWLCEGSSAGYGLNLWEDGIKRREVMTVDFKYEKNNGQPIPEEECINWENTCDGDFLEMTKRFGAFFEYFGFDGQFTIIQYHNSLLAIPELGDEFDQLLE